MRFGSLDEAQDSYTRLGWPVRQLGGVVVLATGRAVDVLEAPYGAAMVALGRWELDDDPGPIATDGTIAWLMVRAGRYPWPGRVAAHAAALGTALHEGPAVRWHAGTGLPLPPTKIGEGRGAAHVWWLSEPKERHTPDDQGLPHPFEVAGLLGQAIDDLVPDGPALRIGERSLLVGAPTSAKQVAAAMNGAGSVARRGAEAAKSNGDTKVASAGQQKAEDAERADDRQGRLKVSWPGGGTRPVGKLEDIVGLLDKLEARADDRGGFVVIEHTNGRRLSIGVGGGYSTVVWADESAASPYLISRGDESGHAVAAARAVAAPDPDAVYIVPGGRLVFVPTSSAVPAEEARRAVVEFVQSGRRPTSVRWTSG